MRLDDGCDPNAMHIYVNDFRPENPNNDVDGAKKSPLLNNDSKFSGYHSNISIPLLFAAIRNCFDQSQSAGTDESLKILALLLDRGARIDKRFLSFQVLNIPGYHHYPVQTADALDFAAFFITRERSTSIVMERVLVKLTAARNKSSALKPPMTAVPATTLGVWKSLLLNDSFSDAFFVCQDRPCEKLHAHRAILAAASNYFTVLFRGGWLDTEEPENGIPTANEYVVMEAILTFIYTGELKQDVLQTHSMKLLAVAAMWELPALVTLCEQQCIHQLTVKSVRAAMEVANAHACSKLLDACVEFVKKNALQLFTKSKFSTLKQSNPLLWLRLKEATAGQDDESSEEEDEEKQEEEEDKDEKVGRFKDDREDGNKEGVVRIEVTTGGGVTSALHKDTAGGTVRNRKKRRKT